MISCVSEVSSTIVPEEPVEKKILKQGFTREEALRDDVVIKSSCD